MRSRTAAFGHTKISGEDGAGRRGFAAEARAGKSCSRAWRYHPVLTDSPFTMLQAEEQHPRPRRGGAGVRRLDRRHPGSSPPPPAYAAWLTCAAITQNLLRAAGALASALSRKGQGRLVEDLSRAWRVRCGRALSPKRVRNAGLSSREPGPVQDQVEQALHLRAGGKEQVPAVLGLIDRVAVTESAALLVTEVQAEAQADRIDPPVADPAQVPYSRLLRPGI